AVSEEGSAAVVPEEPDDGEVAALVLPPPLPSSDDEPLLQPPTRSAAAAPRAVHRTNRAMCVPPHGPSASSSRRLSGHRRLIKPASPHPVDNLLTCCFTPNSRRISGADG